MLQLESREQAQARAQDHSWTARLVERNYWMVRYQGPGAYEVRVTAAESLMGSSLKCSPPSRLADGDEFTLRAVNRWGLAIRAEVSWAESDEWEAARLKRELAL